MAIRIRKLARQLRRPSTDVLGLLLALGYSRYKSPEDMLPSPIEAKVRKAVSKGIRPIPVRLAATPSKPPPAAKRAAGLMDNMLAGVQPLSQKRVSEKRVSETRIPETRISETRGSLAEVHTLAPSAGVEKAQFDAASAILDARQAKVTAAETRLGAAQKQLAVQRASLTTEAQLVEADKLSVAAQRGALAAEREALAAEREVLAAEREAGVSVELIGLTELLEERGLYGADEYSRALRSLGEYRQLVGLLPFLRVADEGAVRRWLKTKLLLVAGSKPQAAKGPVVVVAPERADLPDSKQLQGRLEGFGESLLLAGLRRVKVVGLAPRWHRFFAVDGRVELQHLPSCPRNAALAESDVRMADLVILCGIPVDDQAVEVYSTGRATIVTVGDDSLMSLLNAVEVTLSAL